MSDQSIETICRYQELNFVESFPKQKKCCNIFGKHKEKKKKDVGLITIMLKQLYCSETKNFKLCLGKVSVVIAMMLQSNWKYPVMETMMET